MGTDDRTVVVTGMGATTPLGGDVESTWAGMLAGRSGVKALTDDWAKDLPARIAGVAAADPAEGVGRVPGPPDGPLRAVRGRRRP